MNQPKTTTCLGCQHYTNMLEGLETARVNAMPEEVSTYRGLIGEVIRLVKEGQEQHRDIRCAG